MQDENHCLYEYAFEIVKSDRKWNPNNYNGYGFYNLASLHRVDINNLRASDNFTKVAQILAEISENLETKAEFDSLVKRLIPSFDNWQYDKGKITYVINNVAFDIRNCGSGLISIMRVCIYLLCKESNNILIIDEPENHLSPASQKDLILILAERAKSKQIIVLTHSMHFVKWEFFENGAKFIRFNNVNNNTEVKYLDNSSEYAQIILKGLKNYQKPQAFDICAIA